MKARYTGAVVAAALVAASLTACQFPGANNGSSDDTVTMWYLDGQEDFVAALKDGFEKANPGLKLDATELPEDGYVTKVDTALLANRPPDVGFVYEPRWMKAGSVLPLDDMIADEGIDTSSLNQTALSECELDGALYCLGSLTGASMLIYNKDLFDAAGLDYPSATEPLTIDQFADLAKKLAKPSTDPAKRVWGALAEAPFTWASRATHFSDDGRTIDGFVNDPATVHMYDVLGGMSVDGIAPAAEQGGLGSPADLLASGTAAMAITDMEYAAKSLDQAGYRWGAAPPPVERAGDAPFVFVGTDKYGAFTKGANPKGAKKLIAYIATAGSRIRAEVTDNPPLDSKELEAWVGGDESRQEVVTVLSLPASPSIFVPGFWEVTAPLLDLYAQLGNGLGSADDALDSVAPELQKKLDGQWKNWDKIK